MYTYRARYHPDVYKEKLMTYKASDLNYRGENCGVHNWITDQGQSFYWHPDWLHIAEDETGLHGKEEIALPTGEHASKEHAVTAILRKLNTWAVDHFEKHPDLEQEAKKAEEELKKSDK
ncbi:hypothetical protein EQ875_02172 [Photobacterium damselae subsp. damselae]|nr:hypothetical protein EQ875_02172 [Photobacterium damselae subsp. damselae]SPY24165.1 Uncharacterised protein [Photobacterium damselae]SUB66339.1 Uncharacterised protein [Photobacterium damselae]